MDSTPTRLDAALCDRADTLRRPGQSRRGVLTEALVIGLDVLAREDRRVPSDEVVAEPAIRRRAP